MAVIGHAVKLHAFERSFLRIILPLLNLIPSNRRDAASPPIDEPPFITRKPISIPPFEVTVKKAPSTFGERAASLMPVNISNTHNDRDRVSAMMKFCTVQR